MTKQIPAKLQVTFGDYVGESKYLLLADATEVPIKLHEVNYKDYRSGVCRRMMVSLSREDIEEEINKGTVTLSKKIKLESMQNVMVMSEEFLMLPKYVKTAEDYLKYLIIADSLCIEASRIYKDVNTCWLQGKLNKIKQMHKKYEILFEPVEMKYFNTTKFPTTPTAPAVNNNHYNYPVGNQTKQKYKPIKMNIASVAADDNKSNKNRINIYHHIILLLNQYKMNSDTTLEELERINIIINKLIIIVFADIEKYHYAFSIDFLKNIQVDNKRILEAVIYYPIRQMYLKEQTYYKFGHDGSIGDISSFVVPIDVASWFPVNSDIYGPYNCSTVNFNYSTKWLSAPAHITGERGLCSLENFKERFGIFSGDVLEHVRWSRVKEDGTPLYKMAVCGSTMAACAIRNPREDDFIDYRSYLQYFYPKPAGVKVSTANPIVPNNPLLRRNTNTKSKPTSSIFEEDVSEDSNDDTTKKTKKGSKGNSNGNSSSSKSNSSNSNTSGSDKDSDSDSMEESEESSPIPSGSRRRKFSNGRRVSPIKTTAKVSTIPVSIMDKMSQFSVSDIDIAVECEFADFDESVKLIYNDIKKKYSSAVLIKKETENKHKYVIEGIPRFIDIFHCNSISYIVAKFHLDCVRAWYDGTNVQCFPTFICAANTNMCHDIRWVSNQKDVRDTIMKYYFRGFGTYINNKDLKRLQGYLTPANGYASTGITHNMSSWRITNVIKKPLYGTTRYFGPNYSQKKQKMVKPLTLLKNDKLTHYL